MVCSLAAVRGHPSAHLVEAAHVQVFAQPAVARVAVAGLIDVGVLAEVTS